MERLSDLTQRAWRDERIDEFLQYVQVLARCRPVDERTLSNLPSRVVSVLNKSGVAAGSVDASTWGDAMSWQKLTSVWMSLLSSRTLLGRINFRKVDFSTRTLKEVAPGTAAWVSEGAGIPISAFSLDVVQLQPAKIAGMVVFTKELVEVGSPAGLDNINRAMLSTVGRYTDQALVNPDISASGTSPASLTNGATQVVSTGSSEALFTANLKSLLQVHASADSDLQEVIIIMHPTTALHASQLLTAGNIRAFPDLGVRGGSIWGIPVLTSTGAICSGSPTERVVAVINPAGVIVADNGEIEVSANDRVAIHMDNATTQSAATPTATSVVSLFQTGSTAVKFVRRLNFERSTTTAVSYMRVNF